MLRYGKKLRFTQSEIEIFRQGGIDASHIKTQADWEAAVEIWAAGLEKRPALLEKFYRAIVGSKGEEEKPPPE
jgi:hypothetical protein